MGCKNPGCTTNPCLDPIHYNYMPASMSSEPIIKLSRPQQGCATEHPPYPPKPANEPFSMFASAMQQQQQFHAFQQLFRAQTNNCQSAIAQQNMMNMLHFSQVNPLAYQHMMRLYMQDQMKQYQDFYQHVQMQNQQSMQSHPVVYPYSMAPGFVSSYKVVEENDEKASTTKQQVAQTPIMEHRRIVLNEAVEMKEEVFAKLKNEIAIQLMSRILEDIPECFQFMFDDCADVIDFCNNPSSNGPMANILRNHLKLEVTGHEDQRLCESHHSATFSDGSSNEPSVVSTDDETSDRVNS